MSSLVASLAALIPEMSAQEELSLMTKGAWAMIVCGVMAALALLTKHSAPYGRYAESASGLWGCSINGRLAWVLQEAPCLVAAALCIVSASPSHLDNIVNRVLIGMFVVHYFQRTLIFPLLIRGGKPTPFFVFLMALMFCCANGLLQMRYLTQHAIFSPEHAQSGLFYGGCALFVFGLLVNLHSDHVLRNLRKPGEKGYKIPFGGMFHFVSGANFFGECVEWFGFAMASGFHLPLVAFAVFTVCNIGPRALQHHKWYLNKFGDKYPRKRKALVPFVL